MIKLTSSVWSKIRSAFISAPKKTGPEPSIEPTSSFELFSAEQREMHGKALAGRHLLGRRNPRPLLLDRLDDNARVLAEVYGLLVEDITKDNKVTAAGEWLLDNYYVIEDHIQTAKRHLPGQYSRQLPQLANGSSKGLPRVYDLAMETIYHCDGRIDTECLGGMLEAYQSVTPLRLGELWAIPIMLRLALIENLRRVAEKIAESRRERLAAKAWTERIAAGLGLDPRELIQTLADMTREVPAPTCSFIAELTSRLQNSNASGNMPLPWLEQCLPDSGRTIEEYVRRESQQQASNQVSISNCIGSLRTINALDWRTFVEEMSLVDKTLRRDPAGVYARMNFTTRDRYRHVVEKMARHSPGSEADLARAALDLAARNAQRAGGADLASHVGYYLMGEGKAQLEKEAGVNVKIVRKTIQLIRRHRLMLYLGLIALATLTLTSIFAEEASKNGAGFLPQVLIILFSLFGSAHLSLALVDWLMTMAVKPKPLPRMDYARGLPEEVRTLVVIPAMIFSPENIDKLFSDLEVRFLANQDPNLYFAMLTDFTDADSVTMVDDQRLMDLASERVDQLNLKYPRPNGAFYLFHRPRLWNAEEKKWMGRERKRGKIEDLNDLLAAGDDRAFTLIKGKRDILPSIKYVITLDADTIMARDSARKFIGAMAHPLNHPVYDAERGLVTSGYGLLQPKVSDSLAVGGNSRYASLCVSEVGLDQYTQTTSNVYQDLFGQGSFIGKGIYDLDIFRKVLNRRFPDNRILSHDLLEGCYVRSGFLSDVPLYEEYPSQYSSDVARRHRWIRGDWQISGWLWPTVPGPKGPENNPLSALCRWKIFDNLRRSLTPAALTLLMLTGWLATGNPWCWTLAVLGVVLIPSLLASAINAFKKPQGLRVGQYLSSLARLMPLRLARAAFTLVTLPHAAFYSLDAIVRSLWRMKISRTNLLQWQPSQAAEKNCPKTWSGYWRYMWFSPFLAVAALILLILGHPAALPAASAILTLWFIAPGLCWWLGRTSERGQTQLTAGQAAFLRLLARRTWSFFEAYVTEGDNWLPPDNFQQYPEPKVAHRTSPTNIGLSLLANLSARDFGYITLDRLLDRTTKTLTTLNKMERYRGHLYNWYDTQTLNPLAPRYVSSVDSGNLAGHILTLKAGLDQLSSRPILEPAFFTGLGDCLELILESDRETGLVLRTERLKPLKRLMEQAANLRPWNLTQVRGQLEKLLECAQELSNACATPAEEANISQFDWWLQCFVRQCRDGLNDLILFAPWSGDRPGQDKFRLPELEKVPTLEQLAAFEDQLKPGLDQLREQAVDAEEISWLETLAGFVAAGSRKARNRLLAIEELGIICDQLTELEYDFLFDESRNLLAIGYNVDEVRRDASFYDLLASEARLATFVGIAQGRLPQSSWFALGRLFFTEGRQQVLLSWSGSMFEYLMPLLVMPNYPDTLMDETCRSAVDIQVCYGREKKVPWGVSESGYNMVDAQYNYQYRAFGVPELGLRRIMSDDLVITPYASALALMVDPGRAAANLEALWSGGLSDRFGLFEAVDYTPSRLPRGQNRVVIKSFMAHHQGMTLGSLANALLGNSLQKYFLADSRFQATALLLQERIPEFPISTVHSATHPEFTGSLTASDESFRVYKNGRSVTPEVQLLSNGRYHVMITNSGGGYSRWKDLALTRWREDPTLDDWGSFCYFKDISSGEYWPVAPGPGRPAGRDYETVFTEGRAEFHTRDGDYDLHTDIVVSPEDDVEIRRIKITNRSRAASRTVELTAYAEIALARQNDDDAHPAFSKLFVNTEITPKAIFGHRKPKDENEETPWLLHTVAVRGLEAELSFETDRLAFIGRGRTASDPLALTGSGPLAGGQGWVLDPALASRCRLTIEPEKTVTVDFITGIAPGRREAEELAEKYSDHYIADRVFDMAWTHGQAILSHLGATEAEAQLYNRLAGSVIYANPGLRAAPETLARNHKGQSALWGYSISGDYPIVLLRMEESANLELVRQLLAAHAYWRLKGLTVDLVIWYEDQGGYRQELYDSIMSLISGGLESGWSERPGGVFIRMVERMSEEDMILFQTAARVVLHDVRGGLTEQVTRPRWRPPAKTFPLAGAKPARAHRAGPRPEARPDLVFDNGWGGFTQDGREYVITTSSAHRTPLPWSNVLANAGFGTVITESGPAYTWSENAHEFRLSPWSNDPVSDPAGEIFYLRDEHTGLFWSPTPLPCPGRSSYVTRHGFGYSVFEHTEDGLYSEMKVYVDRDRPLKYISLSVRNDSGRPRTLSATGYVEWVLGDLRAKTGPFINTEATPEGIILAGNTYSSEFAGRFAFFDVEGQDRSFTGDRTEFLGRNGRRDDPEAMKELKLSGRLGPGLDACGALRVKLILEPGQERKIVFRLGAGVTREEALILARDTRGPQAADTALAQVWEFWNRTLGAVSVETPDQGFNMLANGWLKYQTLACRFWGRSSLYQSGGAFGFRDQLQDSLALIDSNPDLVRQHILTCAARQFEEGDVQHWWHPPAGRGVRTKCSDDYLWLPLVTARYIRATGDSGILGENAPYLRGRPLKDDEESYYDLPDISPETGTLYEHCLKSILYGLKFGAHRLPLMGSGDWNDGMDRVGLKGRGESVWLGFFLHLVLKEFGPLAEMKNDPAVVKRLADETAALRLSLEEHAWDGQWYRRAYFDDGSPLGSAQNQECRIDAVAQSWSALSGAGEPGRVREAMAALSENLVDRQSKIIRLLTPPFEKGEPNPGYIKNYPPGVRENGGQYSHAAVWAVMAFAALGDREKAWELFNLISPVNHGRTAEEADVYKAEPYVVAADVYGVKPQNGRGGWSWYTGSSSWLYQLMIESLIGLRRENDALILNPCPAESWAGYRVHYRFLDTVYHLNFKFGPAGSNPALKLDGQALEGLAVPLRDDRREHEVEVDWPVDRQGKG